MTDNEKKRHRELEEREGSVRKSLSTQGDDIGAIESWCEVAASNSAGRCGLFAGNIQG
jgi:hypothetical protein